MMHPEVASRAQPMRLPELDAAGFTAQPTGLPELDELGNVQTGVRPIWLPWHGSAPPMQPPWLPGHHASCCRSTILLPTTVTAMQRCLQPLRLHLWPPVCLQPLPLLSNNT